MIKKEGKHTCNARVDVDYSKGKPKIKFSYPGKNPEKDAIKQGGAPIVFFIIWMLLIIPSVYILLTQNQTPYPKECGNFTLDKIDYNWTKAYGGDLNFSINSSYKAVYGFNLTCDNVTKEFQFNSNTDYYEYGYFDEKGKINWFSLIYSAWFYFSIFPAIFIYRLITKRLVKKKWYQRWLPKANAEGVIFKTNKKNYAKFYPKDLMDNVIVIPKFNNVELDYKTEGDFSDKLLGIKIREYRTQKINSKTKKKSKVEVDHFKWYVIFTFKDKPKNGYLEVIYQ